MRHRLRFTPRLWAGARTRGLGVQSAAGRGRSARGQTGGLLAVGGLLWWAGCWPQAAGLGQVLARLAARGSGRCAEAVRGGGVCMGGVQIVRRQVGLLFLMTVAGLDF